MKKKKIETPQQLADLRASAREEFLAPVPKILVGMATCGLATGAGKVFDTLRSDVSKRKAEIRVFETGCIGACFLEPLVDIIMPDQARITYGN